MKEGTRLRIQNVLMLILVIGAQGVFPGVIPANGDSGDATMKISTAMVPVEGNWEIGGTIGVSNLKNCTLSTFIASKRRALGKRNLQSKRKRAAYLSSRTSGLIVEHTWGETFQSISQQPSEIPVFVRARLACRVDGEVREYISHNVVSVDFSNQTDQVVTLEEFARHLRRQVDRSG